MKLKALFLKLNKKKLKKLEGAELVAEENGWKIYRIDSYEASCLYGFKRN